MLLRCTKILLFLMLFPLLALAENDSLLEKRDKILNRLEVLNTSGNQSVTSAEAELMKQLINTDEQLIENYRNTEKDLTITVQRLQSVQQEKQIYLAQNIQLSTELEELKNELLMLYIVAAFLILLFVGLFILFFVQLKKINDLAGEGQELYNINESMRYTLQKYEKKYYRMKDEYEVISSDLTKLREITAKTEKDYALIEEQLNDIKHKNQVLSQKLNKNNTN